MLITCDECHTKLNVPDSAQGKKIRCPSCKQVVAVSSQPVGAPPPRAGAILRPLPGPARASDDTVDEPASTIRCGKCQAAGVQELPANAFSRHPGYFCPSCGATMRPPGRTGTYVVTIFLGGFGLLLGLALLGPALLTDPFRLRTLLGAVSILVLGGAVAGWSVMQLLRPVPIGAPVRPSRLGLWLILFVFGALVFLVLLGGCLFAALYYVQEM